MPSITGVISVSSTATPLGAVLAPTPPPTPPPGPTPPPPNTFPAVPTAPIPHFLIPFAITDDGSAAVIQQDTQTEVTQSVANLCGTRPGTRLMVPAYGLIDPTFSGVNAVQLQTAVARFEERATVKVVLTAGNQETVVVDVVGGTAQ